MRPLTATAENHNGAVMPNLLAVQSRPKSVPSRPPFAVYARVVGEERCGRLLLRATDRRRQHGVRGAPEHVAT